MAYVPVPKDLTKVKSKVMLNLTKRQIICFGSGALIGVPLFFLLRDPFGSTGAAMVMIFLMMPFFLFALYERNGQPLEQVLRNVIETLFLRSKQRPLVDGLCWSKILTAYHKAHGMPQSIATLRRMQAAALSKIAAELAAIRGIVTGVGQQNASSQTDLQATDQVV